MGTDDQSYMRMGTRCMNSGPISSYGSTEEHPILATTCIAMATCTCTLATRAWFSIEQQQRKRVDLMLDCIVYGINNPHTFNYEHAFKHRRPYIPENLQMYGHDQLAS